MTSFALVTDRWQPTITLWLRAKHGLSGSQHTLRTYTNYISDYRGMLVGQGLDFDAPAKELALLAEIWAGIAKGRSKSVNATYNVANATYNQKLAILSSFFTYCLDHELLDGVNPIDRIQKRRVQDYAGAQVL